MMVTACIQIITLLYIYFCVWGLDLRLNNINYSCWYYLSPIIIISLYWTSETPLSSNIITSECCGNYLSQRQMITQVVNLLMGYQVGNSQENSTRSLFLIRVLYTKYIWSVLQPHVRLISYSRPPCVLQVPWRHLPDPSIKF